MGCFWTDLAGCIEDCQDSVAPSAYAFWGSYLAGATRQDRRYPIVLGATFADVLSNCALSTAIFPDVSLVGHLAAYQIADAGCGWGGTMPAAHGETADALIQPDCDSGTVWKPESFYSGANVGAASSEAINFPLATADQGYGLTACISMDEISALVGLPTGKCGAWIGTFRDNTTGLLYLGSGVLTACY